MNKLLLSSGLYLVNGCIGALVAIRDELPGDFVGRRSGKTARGDFLTGAGTALSPAAWMLMLQAGCMLLARRRGRPGAVGRVGLSIIAIGGLIGVLGEPIIYQVLTPRTFDPLKAVISVGNIMLPVLTLLSAFPEWRRRQAGNGV